jgi:hypothetical protein
MGPVEEGRTPLIATQLHGGPYDTEAYTAGWEMGALQGMLASHQVSAAALTIRDTNLKQADLVCMAYGFVMRPCGKSAGQTMVEITRMKDDV